ncbi:MAG: hypothetical protein V1725_05245 [archaeon]
MKGQSFTADFFISVIIFIAALLLSIKIIAGLFPVDATLLQQEAITLSNYLMSEGNPENWSLTGSPYRIGLLTADRLDIAKYQWLTNQSISYSAAKQLMTLRYDFFINFQNETDILNITACGYGSARVVQDNGNCTFQLNSTSYDNLVKVTRFLLFNSSLIKMNVYVFDLKVGN